jgi:hypothetical protein
MSDDERFWNELERDLARDDDSAAGEHLRAGNPVYVQAPQAWAGDVMRLHPDGRREIVRLDRATGEFGVVADLERLPPEKHWWRLDPAERERRRRAVEFARANVGLEGFTPGVEAEALASRFIDGEIDLATFLSATRASCRPA